jgi:hypothetical protein
MRVLVSVSAALALLALPMAAQAGCSPAHTAEISKPAPAAPQSTPASAPKPMGSS